MPIPSTASEMLFTGKTISAEEGHRIGLINKVVPSDKLMLAAMQMADEICSAAPLAVRYTKELMVRGADLPLEEALRLEDDITPALLESAINLCWNDLSRQAVSR